MKDLTNEKPVLVNKDICIIFLLLSSVLSTFFTVDSLACKVTHVHLYVGKDQAQADSQSLTEIARPNDISSYWVRVDWWADESGPHTDDGFDIKICEGQTTCVATLETTNVSDDDTDDSPQKKSLPVNDSPYADALKPGRHDIHAHVKRDESDDWKKSGGYCKVDIVDAQWQEAGQNYGYDSYSNTDPWKSLRNNNYTDTASVHIDPHIPSVYGKVYFKSLTESNVTVSPTNANSQIETVTFTGVSTGTSSVYSRFDSTSGDNLDLIKVKVYSLQTKTVALRVIHEDDDDTQDIAVGNGLANQLGINDGDNNVMETLRVTDDIAFVSHIDTGANGICNTTANNFIPGGDDGQVISVGQGKQNQICVGPGSNGARDTNKHPNDGYTGNSIHTGTDGVCNTTADSTDDSSTDPFPSPAAETALQNYINNIYDQAVTSFTVTKLDDDTRNWDLDNDGELELSSGGLSSEENVIINNCDPGGYDVIVYYVNNPSLNRAGKSPVPGSYCFVYPDKTPYESIVTTHEIGHALFGLTDITSGDNANLMWGTPTPSTTRLRKSQWDTIN